MSFMLIYLPHSLHKEFFYVYVLKTMRLFRLAYVIMLRITLSYKLVKIIS